MSQPLHLQVATRARQILAHPDHWIQGEFACERDFTPTDPTDAKAYRFCAIGALRRAAHETAPGHQHLSSTVESAIENFIHERHPEFDDSLEDFNDGVEHAAVVSLFDEFLTHVR
jgi:hypothetical protein